MGLTQVPVLPERVPMPPPAPKEKKENFVSMYTKYADVVEAPADAHEAVAIALVGAVLNRNGVYIEHGAVSVPMDIWMLLVSGSGMGRNTLVSLLSPVLKKANLQSIVRKSSSGSPQAFYQDIAENPRGLYSWPEMSVALKKFNRKDFGGAKEWFTDRYDSFDVPDDITYRRVGKGNDTPPIKFTEAPRLNVIATSSGEWLTASLVEEDTTGGFLPRWLILKLDSNGKLVPTPKAPDDAVADRLAQQLRAIDKLRGKAVLSSEARRLYEDWYVKAYWRFMSQPNRALAEPFFRRFRNQVLKLALIHEVAETGRLVISPTAMQKAFSTAEKFEATIFELLPTGMNAEGAALAKMVERIKQVGAAGITKTAFTEAFKAVDPRTRVQRLITLRDAGDFVAFSRPTGGRPLMLYVWKDHVEEHQKQFPTDVVTWTTL